MAGSAVDWRAELFADPTVSVDWTVPPADEELNRLGWPGFVPRRAVRWGRAALGEHEIVLVVWDFEVLGGPELQATTRAVGARLLAAVGVVDLRASGEAPPPG